MSRALGRRDRGNTEFDRAIGARVRELRVKNSMSQTALGEELDVTFQQVQKYESGVNSVSLLQVLKLTGVFEISLAQFLKPVLVAVEVLPEREDAS